MEVTRGVVVAMDLIWGGGGCDGSEMGVVAAAATVWRWRLSQI
jgi:hypothetical protein